MWVVVTGVEHSGKTTQLVRQACSLQGVHVVYAHCSVWPDHSPLAYECLVPAAVSRDWLVIQDRAWIDEWVYSYAQSRSPHFDSEIVEWWIGRLLAYGGVACITTVPYTRMQRGDPPLHLCLERYEAWSSKYPHWRLLDQPFNLEIAHGLVEEARARSKASIHLLPHYTGPSKPTQIVIGEDTQIDQSTARYAIPLWSKRCLISELPPREWPHTAWAHTVPGSVIASSTWSTATHCWLRGGAIKAKLDAIDVSANEGKI
jgi:hypothetical protein